MFLMGQKRNSLIQNVYKQSFQISHLDNYQNVTNVECNSHSSVSLKLLHFHEY